MTIERIMCVITTRHRNPACVARALQPDNLRQMTTRAEGDRVTTEMLSAKIGTVIASVEDYLMNLSIAEELCTFGSD